MARPWGTLVFKTGSLFHLTCWLHRNSLIHKIKWNEFPIHRGDWPAFAGVVGWWKVPLKGGSIEVSRYNEGTFLLFSLSSFAFFTQLHSVRIFQDKCKKKTSVKIIFFLQAIWVPYLLVPQGVSTIRWFINPGRLKPVGVCCPLWDADRNHSNSRAMLVAGLLDTTAAKTTGQEPGWTI